MENSEGYFNYFGHSILSVNSKYLFPTLAPLFPIKQGRKKVKNLLTNIIRINFQVKKNKKNYRMP